MPLKLSIISPTCDETRFIRRSFDSISCQTYPYIEHIIQNAGSRPEFRSTIDAYVETNSSAIVSYETNISQADSILRGLRRASGDVITWLNIDDYYIDSRTIADVMHVFDAEPETDVIYGRGSFVDVDDKVLVEAFVHRDSANLRDQFVGSVGILQPALFFRRRLLERSDPIQTSMTCAFDYDLWVRMLADGARFRFLDRPIANARFHTDDKTSALRSRELLESAEVVRRHYGFASADWLARLAECELHGTNGTFNVATDDGDRNLSRKLAELLFRRFNSGNGALRSLRSGMDSPGYSKSIAMAEYLGLTDFDRIVVTTCYEENVKQCFTLINSLRNQEGGRLPIFVYDAGLSTKSISSIEQNYNVYVVSYPQDATHSMSNLRDNNIHGEKCIAVNDSQQFVRSGGLILWIDTDVAVINRLDPIFEIIRRDHIFLVNQDDKSSWPFYNGTFCHPEVAAVLSASIEELFGEQICSSLLGYLKGGRYSQLFVDAYRYAPKYDMAVSSTSPTAQLSAEDSIQSRPPNTTLARKIASDPILLGKTTKPEADAALGYLGHRQDQTIFSILAARFNAPIQSATTYCRSDDVSSNWVAGSVARDDGASADLPTDMLSTITYHHRGLFVLNSVRLRARPTPDTLVVVGNGPSLKGFDLRRLSIFDTIGMNAAYRYWDQIDWYPTYYFCLDKVVGLSHKDEIARLIRESSRNGIRAFFLRDNLIKELATDVASSEIVFNFDSFQISDPRISPLPITTGSHSSLFGALLGYRSIVLAGIDCNYVEKVQGAVERGANVLEIARATDDNPNYFFAGYQTIGDKYNIPNTLPNLHLKSWRGVAPVLSGRGIKVWNISPISWVDAFPKTTFEAIVADSPPIARTEIETDSIEHASFGNENELARSEPMTLLPDRKRSSPMAAMSRYDRLVLWAQGDSPLINTLGRFAIWTVRIGRNNRGVTVGLLAALAALIIGGFLVPSQIGADVLWFLAVLTATGSVVVLIIGFVGYLLQRRDDEIALKLGAMERQMRTMEMLQFELNAHVDAVKTRVDATQTTLKSEV